MSKPVSGWFTGTDGAGRALIDEVKARGDKINPSEVIGITKDSSGKIIWLEEGHLGNNPSGLAHILDAHEADFNKKESLLPISLILYLQLPLKELS